MVGRTLRILSWNAWNCNDEPRRLTALLDRINPDICCLQELTPDHVSMLGQGERPHVALARDFVDRRCESRLGIVSRFPITRAFAQPINEARTISPSLVGRLTGWIECLDALHAVIDTGPAAVHITNLHLSCAVGPGVRLRQLNHILSSVPPTGPAVVCGDFNSFAAPWINALVGPLFGFVASDYAVRENARLGARAKAVGFETVPSAGSTVPRYCVVLDHILYRDSRLQHAWSPRETYGSDHRPICAELIPN